MTNETAFKEILQKYIIPMILVMIIRMVMIMMMDVMKSKPMRTNVTARTAHADMPKDLNVSFHEVRYCS